MTAGGIECDLLVIGSGAGGLSAAVTAAWHGLKVIVAEKEPVFGGTTAWSGGWMWAPLNPLAQRAGIIEDPEARRAYLRQVLGNNFDEARVDAFLAATPRMMAFLEDHTALQFEGGNKIADTYGNAPGAGTVWRAFGLQPHRAETFKLSTDPLFAEKVACPRAASVAAPGGPRGGPRGQSPGGA